MSSLTARILNAGMKASVGILNNGKRGGNPPRLDGAGVPRWLPGGVRIEPLAIGPVLCEIIRAPGAAVDAAMLYFHGGGYCYESPGVHRMLCAQLSRASGLPVWMLNYRLAPTHPFPAALDDAESAYRLMLELGLAPERILPGGDSAGGGLSMALLLRLRDQGMPLPGGAALLSPWLDLSFSGESIHTNAARDYLQMGFLTQSAQDYAGDQDRRHPLISPLFAELEGLPPLLIQVGGYEILRSEGEALAAKVEAAGGEVDLQVWPEMLHDWQVSSPLMPEARAAVEEIGVWCRTRLEAVRVP